VGHSLPSVFFFALVYIDTAEKSQDQILPRVWLMNWLLVFPSSMACIITITHSNHVTNMIRNVRNGIQQPLPYLLVRLLQVPMIFLLSVCSVTIGGFAICGWNKQKYPIIVTVHALTLLTFEFVAEFFSLLFPNFALSLLTFIGTWFASFLFCGLHLKDFNVMWPIRVFCHILPIRYGARTIAYEEFIGTEYNGAEYCDPESDLHCWEGGYRCDEGTCFGKSGKQILSTLNVYIDLYDSEDRTAVSICILLTSCVFLKLLYVLRVLWVVKYG